MGTMTVTIVNRFAPTAFNCFSASHALPPVASIGSSKIKSRPRRVLEALK